ncbi:hypothetical protein GCK72_021578 [Caenorhabditis remanei]|uniref:Protein SDA1 n=1 Tax=Caenorhabditis remanei TaxID=31234 RepID=A0A6A5GK85_CAERE|nr:hypothetical protein GCK72_021578 [Caenorhabditis remanei]KAF1755011.1 hypothetical protein GCK72_021578 [Caenorhabditis remanei]
MIPPDTVEQLIRVIANNFVTDRNSPEAMTVGINAIREILSNCPFAATEELLRDLSEYKTYKNKNVSMAARSLITLFRAVNPKLLARRDRGKPQEKDDEEKEYNGFARPKVHDFISGAEILDEDDDGGEQGHLSDNEEEESDLDVSDIDTDEVDTEEEEEDDDEGAPVAKKRKVEQKPAANDDEEDDDESDVDDEEEDVDDEELEDVDDEEEDVEVDDEELEDVDDEEEDVEVDDEEDEEAEDEEEEEDVNSESATDVVVVTPEVEDPKKKATKNSMDRILTQEDFKNIRAYQLKKQLIGEKRLKKQMGKGRSNADEQIVEDMAEKLEMKRSTDGLARLSDIEHFYKKKRQTKEERMADITAGRADEDYKFGRPKKNGPHVGRTNEQNSKKKVFAMVKNKVRGRNRQRSFRDQQKSLRNYLMRQSGRKPQ